MRDDYCNVEEPALLSDVNSDGVEVTRPNDGRMEVIKANRCIIILKSDHTVFRSFMSPRANSSITMNRMCIPKNQSFLLFGDRQFADTMGEQRFPGRCR
jgi:hypothetical protein